jgi:hypothetical protein
MREVVERLRPRLRPFRTEAGRELVDLPDAPRPAAGTPAPPRFLPEYDNVLLSHADRSRFVAGPGRGRLWPAGATGWGSVLVDGAVLGPWRLSIDPTTGATTLLIRHPGPLAKRTGDSVMTEGLRLVRFLAPDASGRDVRFERIDP